MVRCDQCQGVIISTEQEWHMGKNTNARGMYLMTHNLIESGTPCCLCKWQLTPELTKYFYWLDLMCYSTFTSRSTTTCVDFCHPDFSWKNKQCNLKQNYLCEFGWAVNIWISKYLDDWKQSQCWNMPVASDLKRDGEWCKPDHVIAGKISPSFHFPCRL